MRQFARFTLVLGLVLGSVSAAQAGLIDAQTTTLTSDPLANPLAFARSGDTLLIGGALGDADGGPDRAALWNYNLTTGTTSQSLYWNGAITRVAVGSNGSGYVGGDFTRDDGYTNGVIAQLANPNNLTTLVTSTGGAGVTTKAVTADGQAIVFNGAAGVLGTLYRAADGSTQYLPNFHGTTLNGGGFSISGGNIWGGAETSFGSNFQAAQWSLSTLAISHPAISGVPGIVDYMAVTGVSGSLMYGAFGTTADGWLHPWYAVNGDFHNLVDPSTGLLVRGTFDTGALDPYGDFLLGGRLFTGASPLIPTSTGLLYSSQFTDTIDPGLIFSQLGDTNTHTLNSVSAIGYYDDTGFLVLGQGSVEITRLGVAPSAVPEPSSIVLCLTGLLVAAFVRFRGMVSGRFAKMG